MCFHGNQLSWAIKHPLISLCLKYHSPGFICFPTILAPVFSSLDEIYCTLLHELHIRLCRWFVTFNGWVLSFAEDGESSCWFLVARISSACWDFVDNARRTKGTKAIFIPISSSIPILFNCLELRCYVDKTKKPDRATMRPGRVSACIDHVTCMERQMDEHVGWLIICFSIGSWRGQKQPRMAVFALA